MSTGWRRGILAGILLLGLLIRLAGWQWGQSYGHFMYGDELLAVERAVEYAQGNEAAQYLGQPQFNANSKLPGPLWTLFCVSALQLGGSPSAAPLLTLLLNVVVIGLAWKLATEVLGERYGLWAALFTATLPWPVFYSLGLYNPVIMAFVFGWLYLALWRVFTRDNSWAIFWVAPILMGSIQIHMSGLMILPAVIVLLFLSSHRLNWWLLLAGVAAGLLFYVPYIRGEMANGWANTAGMVAGGGSFKVSAFKAISSPLNVLGGLIARLFPGTEAYLAFGDVAFFSRVIFIVLTLISTVMGVLFGAALIREFVRMIRRARLESLRWVQADPGITFLAVLVLVPLLSSVLSGRSFQSRYTIVLFPLLMMCPALFIVRWLPEIRWRKWMARALILTVLFHIYLMPAFYWHQGRWIDESPYMAGSHLQLEQIYEALRAATPEDRRIEVDAEAFLDEGEADRWDRQAVWLVPTMCRIQDFVRGLPEDAPAVTYRLGSTRRDGSMDGVAVYSAHGISLVPISEASVSPGAPEAEIVVPAPGG
jgi:hypothetical protein